MDLSRRRFTSLLGLAAVGLALPDSLRAWIPGAQETAFQWVPVNDRVLVAVGGGGNAVLFGSGGEGVLTDGKNFGLGRILRREADSLGTPVSLLVNTHHHGDHSGGNAGFSDLPRRAHANTVPRIRATAEGNLARAAETLPRTRDALREQGAPATALTDVETMMESLESIRVEDFLPTDTFQQESEVALGGRPLELRWVSRGHTDGDNFIFLPTENVLHTGDLFFHGRHPYVDDSAGATPQGWIDCLDAMLALCDSETVVVPGHGEITDREGLAGQKAYFDRMQAMVEEGIYEGRSRAEIMALAPDDLAALPGAERHLPRNLGIIYDELAG